MPPLPDRSVVIILIHSYTHSRTQTYPCKHTVAHIHTLAYIRTHTYSFTYSYHFSHHLAALNLGPHELEMVARAIAAETNASFVMRYNTASALHLSSHHPMSHHPMSYLPIMLCPITLCPIFPLCYVPSFQRYQYLLCYEVQQHKSTSPSHHPIIPSSYHSNATNTTTHSILTPRTSFHFNTIIMSSLLYY